MYDEELARIVVLGGGAPVLLGVGCRSRGRVLLEPVTYLRADGRLVLVVIVASNQENLQVWCATQAWDLVAADVGGGGAVAWGVGLFGEGIVGVGGESAATCNLLCLEAIETTTAERGCYRGLSLFGGFGGGEGIDELDMQCLDGSKRAGV